MWYECILMSKIIKTRSVTFFPFSTFFPFFDVYSLKMAFSCEAGSAMHLCAGVSILRVSFQGSCALFPSGKRFSLCSQQLHLRQADSCPCSHGEVTRWPLSSHSTSSVLEQQRGSSSKLLPAFSIVSHQDKSSPYFCSPEKVAATRVTFNNPTWQRDRKGRLKMKNKTISQQFPPSQKEQGEAAYGDAAFGRWGSHSHDLFCPLNYSTAPCC